MEIYKVWAYPDRTFKNDSIVQLQVTDRMKSTERCVIWLFGGMGVDFVAMVAFAILGFPMLAVIGIGMMFLLLFPAAVLLLWQPMQECPQCQQRMKREWAPIRNGRSGEFLLCPGCRVFLFTHRTSR
jgi:hypothetical protein